MPRVTTDSLSEALDEVMSDMAAVKKTVREKTVKEQEQEQALNELARLGGKTVAEEDIVFQGTKLIIPEKLTLSEAQQFIEEKIEEDEQVILFAREFHYRPWDGAHATMVAIKKAFGMMQQKPTMGMFGPNPPVLISIKTDVGESTQVPWGALTLPQLPGVEFRTGSTMNPELGMIFTITAKGPRKYRFEVEGLFNLVQNELKTNSIYRGKAFDGQENPEFLDLTGVDPEKVIYSDDVLEHLNANVWTPLEHTTALRDSGMPLKRSVLFEGPYGTGKTLAAYLTAKKARENGWTFVYVRPGRDDFEASLATARLYQPAVVFFEDVDTTASPDSGGEDHVSKMLDLFDGVQAKGTEIIVVLTTNHVDKVHKGMLRPGRLDAIIHIGALDHDGIERLIKVSTPTGQLADDIDWDAVATAMDGFMPAFVKETASKAVMYAVSRNDGRLAPLTTNDLVCAAEGLRDQFNLMESAQEFAMVDPLTSSFEKLVQSTVNKALAGTQVASSGDATDIFYQLVPEDIN